MSGMGTGGLALESELSVATSTGGAVLHAQLSAVEFALFAQYGVRRTLQADQVLFRRGDLGSSMFIIVSGTVSLDFGAGLAPKPMGSNDFFGELGTDPSSPTSPTTSCARRSTTRPRGSPSARCAAA